MRDGVKKFGGNLNCFHLRRERSKIKESKVVPDSLKIEDF